MSPSRPFAQQSCQWQPPPETDAAIFELEGSWELPLRLSVQLDIVFYFIARPTFLESVSYSRRVLALLRERARERCHNVHRDSPQKRIEHSKLDYIIPRPDAFTTTDNHPPTNEQLIHHISIYRTVLHQSHWYQSNPLSSFILYSL